MSIRSLNCHNSCIPTGPSLRHRRALCKAHRISGIDLFQALSAFCSVHLRSPLSHPLCIPHRKDCSDCLLSVHGSWMLSCVQDPLYQGESRWSYPRVLPCLRSCPHTSCIQGSKVRILAPLHPD